MSFSLTSLITSKSSWSPKRTLAAGCLTILLAPWAGAQPSFVTDYELVPVGEGSTMTLKVSLSGQPDDNVTASVTRVSGDTDLSVQSGATISIPKGSWDTPVNVVLSASEDADNLCSRGLFQITETSANGIAAATVEALEVDNDATTAVGGDITTNTTWADTTQAYLITSTVVVKEGVKLTIAPGVTVRHENNGFSAFSLEGDLEAQAGATLLMRTRAYWSESLRRHAIVVKEGAQASFAGANVLTTETDSYSTEGVDRWAAAVRAEEGSQIVVSGALFQSMNTNSNWRTGYGVYIDQTFASFTNVPVENRFRGFRVAVFQHAADVQQVIQPLAMIQCERNHMFSGTIVRDMTIQNHDVQLYGDVTVEVTATLTLAPGSELETGEGERLYVKGAIVGTDAQVTARSRAYWNLNDRRHVIYLINNGRGEFQRCRFETTETNGYATDGDSSYWAAVLYAEAGAQLTVRGCTFVSTNSINSWRVGYGIRLEGATAEVSDDGAIRNSFTGFRAGIYQFFSGASQEIAVCDFSDCEWNVWINGDVIRNQTLRNSSTHAVGSFTVGATSTLTLAPGSQLYKSEGVRITVRGRVEADSAHYVPRTRAYWNETSRQHGLYFVEGGGGSFDDCTLTCTEVDGYANDGNTSYWAAALYGDATAELSIRGCTFESTNTVNNYRTGYGVRVEGGAITLGDLAGAMTRMTGFRCGIRQQFGSRPQEISLFQQNDLQIGMYLVGDLVSDATLVNRNLRMIGNLTVGPGATLTMTPGSDLYVPGYSLTFLVQGALVARDATLTLETRAHWQDSTRRHGLWVRNGGRCDLEDCRLVATEYDGYANDNNSDYWAGAIYADNTATLLVRACRFISTRATNNYPVGYGIRLEGATAEIAGGGVPSSMQGFRTGVLQVFSSNQQNIETLALADTPWGVRIRGTLSGDLTLRNGNMLVDRDLTITGNTTLSVAPDSYLYTNGYLITVDPGSGFSIASSTMEIWRHVRNRGVVSATDTKFIVRTYAHPNANDRFFGFDLRNSSQSTFRNCSFYTTETRTTGDNNDWSALFYLADTARLALYGCYATNAPSGAGHYTRFVVRSFSQGALTLQDSIFTQNYIALQVDAVPGQTLVKNNDFHGNTWAIINNTQPDFVARENWWGSPTGPTHIENPGGSGDRVSDRVDYGQSSLEQPETLLSVHNPLVGQEHSNLIASGTQLGVELMGVRFEPFSSNIAQVAFRLTNRSGVEWADIRNYRLMVDANGNGTIDPGETVRVGGSWLGGQDAGTFIVRFAGAFVSHADATPAYILVADFHNMEAGDTVTVNVDGAQTQAGEPGVGVSVLTTPVTHVAGAQVFVIDRLGGQVPDALNGYGRQNNVALCAFRLTGTQQSIKVLEFTLTNLVGLSRGNFIAASLYLDANGDGVLDAGDTRIGGATEISISGSTGKIVFGSAFNTGGSYLLTANLRGLEAGDHMVVNLTGDKIQTDAVVPVYGAVTPAVHDVDMPYSLALSEVWNKPTHFGQQIDQARFPLMGMRLLPLSRTVNGITLRLSGIVGIGTSEMVNARIYWDKNDNGVLDAADEPVSSTGVVSMAGNTGSVLFAAPFIVRGNYIIAADMRTLANGDEITVSMDSSDVIVPEGYVVTGAIPGIRYVVQQGVADSRTRNQRWTLTFRSPGGTSVNGRFNNAGDKVILGYDTGSAWIYDSQANVPLLMLKDHYDRVEYAGFSSDDSAAITVTRDGAVYVWDLATGSQRSSLFSDLLVTSAVPSPDFSKLMVITEGKGILLDIDNEQRLWEYVPGQATVNAIAYSPNGQYVLIGSSDKRAYLLDAATGVEVRRFIGHTQPVTAVAFTGDGSTLMTSSTDAVVQLWATDNGQPLGGPPITTISLQGQSSQGAAVSRDGSRVAMVTGSGGSAQMRMFAANGLELFAVNIDQKSGGNWTGSLDSLSFDAQGTRVLITSGNNPWGRNASFRVDNGDYLVSWGPQGRFWGNQDGRPRMSRTGDRIFMMTDWGLNVVSTTMEKPILRSPNIPGDRGFDVSADGGKVAWFTAGGNLRVDAVADSGFSTLLDRAVGANNHNAVTMSPGGDMVIDGDRLFSAHTGDLLANYALPDREARSAFSPDATRWGFAIPQDKSLITLRTNDPNAVLQNLMQTDPYTPYKMFYFPDNKRIAAVDGGTGVQAYDMTTDLPVGLYRYPSNSDAALSEDGTLLLLGGTNHVRLIETRTGRILRYFYPQHSSIQTVGVYGVQFADHDSVIMIGWSYNYVETYRRSRAAGLEITPAVRKLAAGESQAFHVDVIYDDGTRSDVTPSSAAPEDRAILRVEPPTAATVSGNVITVAAGATGSFVVRALYREGSDTFSDEAVVTVGLSHLVELVPSPVKMTVVPGVFRSINYTARYDDGYETDVSTLVSVVTDRPEDMVVAGQSVKVNLTAIPGDFLCTGTYTDSHNDTRQAVTTVTMFGPKTAWERYRVTGGGYGLSGDFSPNGQKLAAGSGSGAINLYKVGVTPSQYQLTHVIPAHEGSISYLKFINNDKIISVGGDGSIAVWDLIVSSTTPVTRFYHDAPITAAQLSGAKLAFGDSLGNVGVYDYPSDATEWLSPIHSGPVTAIAVDVDTILSGGDDHRVKVIKRSDGTVLKTIVAHTEAIQSVGWMGASKFFILGGDNSLSFWRKSDLEIIDRYDYPAETSHAEYIGDQLYVGTNEPVATWVYNSDGLLLRWLEHPPSEGKVKKYLIDPSGKYILTGRASSKVVVETFFGAVEKVSKFSSFQFWEVGRGIFRGSLAHSFPLGTAFTSADGGKIFTQDPKRTMSWSFDVASGTTEGRVLLETGYFIAPAFAGLDFTADTRILATRVDVSIYMFDTFTNLLWKTLHTPGAGPFAISPDGSRMATSDFRTRLWDLGNLSLIREDTRVASSLDFRGNDRFLGGISGSSFVAIFNQDGLFFNGFDTAYPPAHLFVNALGTRAAVVTVQIVGDLFDVSYNYFLEVFDISNLSIEIPRVTPPIYLLTTKEDIFGGGEGQVGFRLAVSEDTALALVGAEGDRPVRLVNLNDGSTIREFLPPGGGGDLNLGAAAVGFTDNDDSVMIAWAEGFAELHRRVRPNDLDLLVSRVESGKAPHPGPLPQGEGKGMVERFLARMKTGGTLYVDAGAVYSTQSIAQYANGAQLNVTSTASLVSDNTAVATVSGRYVTIAANAPDGAVAALTASYDELGDELSATVTLKVGEPPRLPGDLNGDGKTDRLDLFIFSMWWMQPDSGTGANHLADMIDDDQINANDLLELIKWYHGALPGE